jgi:hypothetical protein
MLNFAKESWLISRARKLVSGDSFSLPLLRVASPRRASRKQRFPPQLQAAPPPASEWLCARPREPLHKTLHHHMT